MPTNQSAAGRLEVLALPGVPRAVAGVRGCLRDLLGPDHARLDDVLLCSSELLGNALRHSDSGKDGGRIRVEIAHRGEAVKVSVIDDGGAATEPRVVAQSDGESGRGLRLVEALADDWGFERRPGGLCVWFVTG
jgi:anti-sigma regulatory factor (Ser/Thr protein kinase)